MLDVTADLFDQDRLEAVLSALSDEELTALEDDLDFCNFTGVPSQRVLEVLNDFTQLDSGWQAMLKAKRALVLPFAS